jgi:two-component system response regulator FixJ
MTPSEQPPAEIVCLVDDDPAVLKSIGRLLAAEGFSVQPFSRPRSFLDYIQTNRVPLVVLDIWMEEMSGLEVQGEVSALSPGTRVIVITGREDPVAKAAALERGVSAFFTKPFDADEFLVAVRSALAMPVK